MVIYTHRFEYDFQLLFDYHQYRLIWDILEKFRYKNNIDESNFYFLEIFYNGDKTLAPFRYDEKFTIKLQKW